MLDSSTEQVFEWGSAPIAAAAAPTTSDDEEEIVDDDVLNAAEDMNDDFNAEERKQLL